MGFIEANGLSFFVQQSGNPDGQTLIFVNSLGSDYRIWDDILPHFSDYDILRYDLRGHGLSDCPPAPYTIRGHGDDLVELMRALQISEETKIVLIGISVGGMIAMEIAFSFYDKVKALILLDTFPKLGIPEMWNERIDALREHGMTYLADAILSRWFAPSFEKNFPVKYRGYFNMITRMPVEGYTGTCEAIRDADLTDATRTIVCPTLVLCGTDDQSTPPSLVSGLTKIIPNSRYIEIKNAGHLPCVENPQATAKAIKRFLEEVL